MTIEGTSAESAGSDAPVVDEAEIERRRLELDDLLEMMRPSVQLDGGDLRLISADYVKGIVDVQLEGACGSCAIAELTIEGGVERLLRDHLDWITEVTGGVDESVDPLVSAAAGRGAYVPRYG